MMSENTTPPEAVKPRGKPSSEGRFLWIACLALERILNTFGQTQAAFGVAVYLALVKLSSKAKNPTFQASVAEIAGGARIGYRKALETLHDLQDKAKVIAITEHRTPGRKTQEQNSYTLLSLRLPKRKSGSDIPAGSLADFPGRTPSRAEIPIDSVLKDREEEEPLVVGDTATQSPTKGSSKNTWEGECN